MSLSRAILRLTAVQAIKGRTLAEARVYNSDLDPLDQRMSAEKLPVIVIFTDDQQEELGHHGDMGQGQGSVDLVIEIAIAGKTIVSGTDQNDQEVQVTIGETDAGMEFTLDLLERQIIAALTAGDGPWPDLWRVFCTKILRRVSRRGGSAESGARFAARQIVLTCETLIEPPPGVPYFGGAWERLIDAVSSAPNLAPLAPILRAELNGDPAPDWAQAARLLGVNLDTVSALGLGAVAGLGEDPALLTAAEIAASAYLPPSSPPLPPVPSPEDVPMAFGLGQLISGDEGNSLSLGSDGRLVAPDAENPQLSSAQW